MSLLTNQSQIRPSKNFWSSAVAGDAGFKYIGGFLGATASSALGDPIVVGTPFTFNAPKSGTLVVYAVGRDNTGAGTATFLNATITVDDVPIASSFASSPPALFNSFAVSGGATILAGNRVIQMVVSNDPAIPGFSVDNASLAVFFFE